jgi:hypothetical protein
MKAVLSIDSIRRGKLCRSPEYLVEQRGLKGSTIGIRGETWSQTDPKSTLCHLAADGAG